MDGAGHFETGTQEGEQVWADIGKITSTILDMLGFHVNLTLSDRHLNYYVWMPERHLRWG